MCLGRHTDNPMDGDILGQYTVQLFSQELQVGDRLLSIEVSDHQPCVDTRVGPASANNGNGLA